MQPGYARIVYCPYCGEKKELLSLMSGNTIGARYWSDLRMRAPMLPEVSPVQKCHHCGKYYLQYARSVWTKREMMEFQIKRFLYQMKKKLRK